MSQRVPTAPGAVPMLDYDVAELTWQNGQLSMNGMGLPRVPPKPTAANNRFIHSASQSKNSWEKLPRTSGTLESIVNQATTTRFPHTSKSISAAVSGSDDGGDLVPWLDPRRAAAASITMTMDALVPCSNRTDAEQSTGVVDSVSRGIGTCVEGCSTRVGSCSAAARDGDNVAAARVPVVREWRSREQSVSGRDSHHVTTLDTGERELDVGNYGSTSMGSPENTSSAWQWTRTTTIAAADDHDSVCHSTQRDEGDEEEKMRTTVKSSGCNKRSRAAVVHNQSERKRRDKINQRMKTLQKLVPNSSQSDKASILDEVIEYVKQLQAQVQMMSRMSMPSMMLPMTLQQLQMSMMPPMGMGLGMGMGMGLDINSMSRPNIPAISHMLHPTPASFMPMAVPAMWNASGGGDRLQGNLVARVVPDPLSTFLACQSRPMNMDEYSKIVTMYQQLQQAPASSSKC